MRYESASTKKTLLFLLAVGGGCSTASSNLESAEHQVFTLTGCLGAVQVSFPKEFSRAPSDNAIADKKSCRYTWNSAGSYECLYTDWLPEVVLPRVEVKVWPTIRYDPTQPFMGGPSQARDVRIIAAIRRYEPSAPNEDRALKDKYAQFFYASKNTSPHLASEMRIEGSYVSGGRFYYAHGCVVSVEYFVPFPSDRPMSVLNGYIESTDLK